MVGEVCREHVGRALYRAASISFMYQFVLLWRNHNCKDHERSYSRARGSRTWLKKLHNMARSEACYSHHLRLDAAKLFRCILRTRHGTYSTWLADNNAYLHWPHNHMDDIHSYRATATSLLTDLFLYGDNNDTMTLNPMPAIHTIVLQPQSRDYPAQARACPASILDDLYCGTFRA